MSMLLFHIVLGLLMGSPSFGSPTREKLLRHLLPRNGRDAVGEGGKMDPEFVRRNGDYSYQGQIMLPVCDNVRPPSNGVISCSSVSSSEDKIMRCLASCNENSKFPDGSREQIIVCTIENENNNWNLLVQMPGCLLSYTESLEVSEDTEVDSSLPACASLKPPTNGRFFCKIDYSYGSNIMQCKPSCNEDYEFTDSSGERVITCTIEVQDDAANRYIQIPSCKPKNRSTRCEKNLTARNQIQRCFVNEFVRRCDSTCIDGYNFPNGEKRMRIRCPKNTGIFTPVDKFPDCLPDSP